jgi:hypothetical protein
MHRSETILTTVGVISFRTTSELCCFRNTSESSTQAFQVLNRYGYSKLGLRF